MAEQVHRRRKEENQKHNQAENIKKYEIRLREVELQEELTKVTTNHNLEVGLNIDDQTAKLEDLDLSNPSHNRSQDFSKVATRSQVDTDSRIDQTSETGDLNMPKPSLHPSHDFELKHHRLLHTTSLVVAHESSQDKLEKMTARHVSCTGDMTYSAKGKDDTLYVRRETSYFNHSRNLKSPRQTNNHSRVLKVDDGNGQKTLMRQAKHKRANKARESCAHAAKKAGLTPILIVLVWITTGMCVYSTNTHWLFTLHRCDIAIYRV